MNQEVFNILLFAWSSAVIGSAIGLGLIYYDHHLRKNIKVLEKRYVEFYGDKPRGPINETFGGLADYRTFLKYAIGLKS